MIKNRHKNPSEKKLHCKKDHCCGVENIHDNFISTTSRNPASQSKKKKKSKKKDSMNQILKESYIQLKKENE